MKRIRQTLWPLECRYMCKYTNILLKTPIKPCSGNQHWCWCHGPGSEPCHDGNLISLIIALRMFAIKQNNSLRLQAEPVSLYIPGDYRWFVHLYTKQLNWYSSIWSRYNGTGSRVFRALEISPWGAILENSEWFTCSNSYRTQNVPFLKNKTRLWES